MKSRQGTSNPKFVRKTSQSPWDHPRTACILQEQPQTHTSSAVDFKLNTPKNYFTLHHQKPTAMCARGTCERANTSLEGMNQGKKIEAFPREEVRVQQFKVSGEDRKVKDNQEIDDIYIPIESVSTVESIPTARKKPVQNQELGLQTKRKQQLEWVKKDIKKILEQNAQLLRSQGQKTAQIARLNLELEATKMHNTQIQAELKKLIEIVYHLEHELRLSRNSGEELRRNLQQTETKRGKLETKVSELTLLLAKLQFDVKCHKQENEQLARNLKLKEKEIVDFKSQIVGRTNADKYQTQTGARVVRSVSIQQSYFPEHAKVYTMRSENPPVQKYNRFIQTQNCKLEVALKENEMLMGGLKCKEKTMKSMQKEIHCLNKRVKTLDQTIAKLQESQKLIEDLNKQILVTTACKFANKYRYF